MGIKLGSAYKDSITGFQGVAIGRFEYLSGCVRIEIQSMELKDGKPIDSMVFDEQRLTACPSEQPGGPMPDPPSLDSIKTRR